MSIVLRRLTAGETGKTPLDRMVFMIGVAMLAAALVGTLLPSSVTAAANTEAPVATAL